MQSWGTSNSEIDHSRYGAANPGPCPISANLSRMFSVKLPQNCHPERSAITDGSCDTALVARSRRACPESSRGNLGGAYFTHAARSFSTTKARQQDLLRYALDGHGSPGHACTIIIPLLHRLAAASAASQRPY